MYKCVNEITQVTKICVKEEEQQKKETELREK